jgi:hypothetical protein
VSTPTARISAMPKPSVSTAPKLTSSAAPSKIGRSSSPEPCLCPYRVTFGLRLPSCFQGFTDSEGLLHSSGLRVTLLLAGNEVFKDNRDHLRSSLSSP